MAELKLTIDANKALRDRVEVRTAERDAAVAHLRAVLDWSNTERFAGRTRHENDAPSSARSFLDGLDELQTSPKTSKDLDLCDECGCIGLCDPRCSLVPVQQEPGRYSDRERVADYLASAQGVEFHDLNDDAQREWLMRASDALRAVWSIGRLVDADDGYEVMCEPVAAMVEDVRAALVPVQQDEPEACAHPKASRNYTSKGVACGRCNELIEPVPVQQDEPEGVCAFPNCSCTENRCPGVGGEPCRGCGVPTGVGAYHHIGCRTPEPNPAPVQQEPERESNYESPTDPMWALIAADRKASKRRRENGHAPGYGSCFRGAVTHTGADFLSALNDLGWTIAPAAGPSVGLRDRVRDAILAELHGRPFLTRASATKAADRVLSVLHEAGTQEDEA